MMAMKPFPLSSSSQHCFPPLISSSSNSSRPVRTYSRSIGVWAKTEKGGEEEGEVIKENKQSLFGSITEALDFSKVRSSEDALLLDEAREATKSGNKMSREQYGALRRKIGGTYKDFFKSYVDVDGEYVEEGWVDKTCKVCKKDTSEEPRQVDRLGRYVHVACVGRSKPGANFFSKFFSR